MKSRGESWGPKLPCADLGKTVQSSRAPYNLICSHATPVSTSGVVGQEMGLVSVSILGP